LAAVVQDKCVLSSAVEACRWSAAGTGEFGGGGCRACGRRWRGRTRCRGSRYREMKMLSGPAWTLWVRGYGHGWETRTGRPSKPMSCELGVVRGRPCDWSRCAESTNPSLSCVPPRSRSSSTKGESCVEWGLTYIATFARSRSRRTTGFARLVGSRPGWHRSGRWRRAWPRTMWSRLRQRPVPTRSSPCCSATASGSSSLVVDRPGHQALSRLLL
jgi:hypothetical protein